MKALSQGGVFQLDGFRLDPECRDLHIEIAVFDRGVRQNPGKDLGPRDEFTRPRDQQAENVECARPHRQRRESAGFILSEQGTAFSVEPEPLE